MPPQPPAPRHALDDELAAMCLEERPQLYALAGIDYAADDGGLIGWVLAWPGRVVLYCYGRSRTCTFPDFAAFWKASAAHPRADDLRLIPMDGRPVPEGACDPLR